MHPLLPLAAAGLAAGALNAFAGGGSFVPLPALMAGATVGGWLGAVLGRRLPAPWVRGLTVAFTAAITAAFFLKTGH